MKTVKTIKNHQRASKNKNNLTELMSKNIPINLTATFLFLFFNVLPLNVLSAEGLSKEEIELVKQTRRNKNNSLFKSSFWIPDAGVTLLNEKTSRSVWSKFSSDNSSCGIRNLNITIEKGTYPISSFYVFQTTAVNIFLFNFHMNAPGEHWVVCDRYTTQFIFDSYDGRPAFLIHPLRVDSEFGGCPSPAVTIRFRRLVKEGPLFLEAYAKRCQSRENHYEVLFNPYSNKLQAIPGSRMAMDWRPIKSNSPWSWWYVEKKYERREIVWNENGEASWSRILGRVPNKISDEYNQKGLPMVLVEENCFYSEANSRVKCKYKIIKNQKIKNYSQFWLLYSYRDKPDEKIINDLLDDVIEFRKAGFIIDDSEIEKLKAKKESSASGSK